MNVLFLQLLFSYLRRSELHCFAIRNYLERNVIFFIAVHVDRMLF
jgi:hypothetical protein